MFRIPNRVDATYARQAGIYSFDFDTIALQMAGDGTIFGLGVSAQGSPNMTVAVAAGMCRQQGYFAFVSAQNVSIPNGDATYDRIDLIVVDWNGTVSRSAGTPAERPVPPALPSNSIPLAAVYVQAGRSTSSSPTANINAVDIIDKRPVVQDDADIGGDFMGSCLSNTAATSAGSIGEMGWTMSGTTAAPTFQTSVAGRPGVLRSATGTTSGNRTSLHFGNAANSAIIAPVDIARMTFGISIPTITTMAAKFGHGVDLSQAAAGDHGTAGMWVEYLPATSLKWRYCTRQASVTTVNTDTGADVAAGSWYRFDIIRKQNGNVQFLKNLALMFEHTANLPTTVGNVGATVHTLTAAARNLDHDYFAMNIAPISNRWS